MMMMTYHNTAFIRFLNIVCYCVPTYTCVFDNIFPKNLISLNYRKLIKSDKKKKTKKKKYKQTLNIDQVL